MHAILGITFEKLFSLQEYSQNLIEVDAPELVDYQNLDNFYLTEFGQDNWKTHIT